ncbi:SUMF1/EgtB/PvdO family nonheme iron enzyme [uncultured Tenacibaculum sp.]|uniref:SUMF1/EgtB/PvdO family nonheme iron enzyme n=1 Tax=uncultured Tenacibaculum sp. TaxID=174713 RepID=UPI00260DA205|nr:SUMF1/EgtB/PvdO family nonheme iron enzyme [uncultured Tenacibaculum sp.]
MSFSSNKYITIDKSSRFLISISMLLFLLSVYSCAKKKEKLIPVSYAQFETFVKQTGYITDAEKYGWSIVQINVYDFKKVDSANWKKPDGINIPSSKELPITQVSYNDAMAYCKWSKTRLPKYNEYWDFIKTDKRTVVSNNELPISPVKDVNILGNVWDITETKRGDLVRLAGGSLFCSETTCHGTVKNRELFVDEETGNIHIGFSVIK